MKDDASIAILVLIIIIVIVGGLILTKQKPKSDTELRSMVQYLYDEAKEQETQSRLFTESLKRGEVPRLPGILRKVKA